MVRVHLSPEQISKLKDNFSMSPSYSELITDTWSTVTWYYSPEMWCNYSFPKSFVDDFTRNLYFHFYDVYYIVFIAIFITLCRYGFERSIYKLLVNRLNLTTSNRKKFPESVWKLFFHLYVWSHCFYLIHYHYDYFDQPYLIWDDWSPGMAIPSNIKLFYFVQCGFYVYSIYATLYMEVRRKDFHAMLLHHVLTVTLIFASYALRYHKIGLVVLYLHDISDIWLGMTKVTSYLKLRQDGQQYPQWKIASNVSFIMFALSWLLCRLYWYPLKVLYSTGVVAVFRTLDTDANSYATFNILLWVLLGLNIYWFSFVLRSLYKVIVGSGLSDLREDDDTQSSPLSNSSYMDQKKT